MGPSAAAMGPVTATLFVSTAAISDSVSNMESAPFTNIDMWEFK